MKYQFDKFLKKSLVRLRASEERDYYRLFFRSFLSFVLVDMRQSQYNSDRQRDKIFADNTVK
jgi:hypothetical protein